MIFLDHVNPLSIWSQRSSFMSSPELQLHGGFLIRSTTECSHRSHGAFTSSSATIVAPAFPVWWCVVGLSADPEFVCVFKDGSLSSCRNKLTSSCFRLKVLMSWVCRSNSLLGAVGVISLFKGVMAALALPEYVLSSNVEEPACGDVYLHLIFQNSKHIPEKVITWL